MWKNLKESERTWENPKESRRNSKIPAESPRMGKNVKEPKNYPKKSGRMQKNA